MRFAVYSRVVVLAVGIAALGNRLAAEEPSSPAIDFSLQILPILSDKCFVCHGPDGTEKEVLRLDSYEAATSDLGGHRAIDPQSPAQSTLLARIASADEPMPPAEAEKQLTDDERSLLVRWVREGAAYATHWSFIPPRKVLPSADQPLEGNAAIDAFIAARLAGKGIDFAPQADRAALARRAALVLTGLPPEPSVLAQFLADDQPDAYERLVDRLLASPRFGEHQARYWLDAVRYGDTHGLHLDNRRGIYPYRDWVVFALNRNLPLDDFLTWQLAGDLLPEPTLEQQVASGFIRLNPSTSEGGVIPDEFQAKNSFDRVETLGTVFLGLTLTCARCHTHKYDPISHSEYFQLLAFFNSTAENPLDGNAYEYGPVVKAPASVAAWQAWSEWEAATSSLLEAADNRLRAAEGIEAKVKEAWNAASSDARLALAADSQGPLAGEALQNEAGKLLARRLELEKEFTTTLVAKELDQPRSTRVLKRGEYDLPVGDPLQPGTPLVIGAFPNDLPRNRLGLAKWLTARDHPLVAQVLVNRMWQGVFGDGLVRTPEDFGLQGQQPTHPGLLDWLAVELHDSGWDLKHMLRLMVTSRTFRQQSAWRVDVDDPENRLLARGPRFRLDAEVIRDVGLWASQLLEPTMGGEGVKPYQPSGLWEALMHPASNTKSYVADAGNKLYRRSLYVYWKRTCPHPMLTLFDAPSRESSCVRRSRTNTSLQSLGLLNETQRTEMARMLAERLLREQTDEAARLDMLFSLLACRQPSPGERAACMQLLTAMQARYGESPADAQALLAIGEAARDTKLEIAHHAAWTQVAVAVLASDIAIMLY